MSYSANETGLQSGKPVELYEFRHGPDFYRYTSADVAITHDSKLYEPRTISRSNFESTSEKARTPINVSIDKSVPVLDLFRVKPPDDVIALTIYRKHRGDTEAIVAWMGRVLNVTWDGPKAVIHCESAYTSIKRQGLRRLYQRQCPHVLYSAACAVSSATHRYTTTVAAVSGLDITLNSMGAYSDNHFAGGYIEWEYATGKYERRAISSHVGAVVSVNFPIQDLVNGATVRVYPGCDHTIATCNAKFSNSDNYGGFTHIPQKNPFGSSPLY